MSKTHVNVFFLATLGLVSGAHTVPASAKYENEIGVVDKLVAARKYQSAAEFISDRQLIEDPRFARRYVHVLARHHLATNDFTAFAVKDLAPDEELDRLRRLRNGADVTGVKHYSLDMDEFLYRQLKEHPKSQDIQFAIGDYLSASALCECRPTKYFKGKEDADYYKRAYEGGIYDDWSLFRIGYSLLYTRRDEDLAESIRFLEKSRELNPQSAYATYHLAIAHYFRRDLERAHRYATDALGKFADRSLNANAYAIHGRVNTELKRYDLAEQSFRTALEYDKWHKQAFAGLLRLHLSAGNTERYGNEVKRYLAQDYADPKRFENYSYYLDTYGMTEVDRALIQSLGGVALTKPEEIGMFNLRLGDFHQNLGELSAALQYYEKSRKGFKRMRNPPAVTLREIDRSIANLRNES